jgi:hypothetical protein
MPEDERPWWPVPNEVVEPSGLDHEDEADNAKSIDGD